MNNYFSPSCTAKEPFGLRVKLAPAQFSTVHGGGFTLSRFFAERQARKAGKTYFSNLWSDPTRNEPKCTVSVAVTLSTRQSSVTFLGVSGRRYAV